MGQDSIRLMATGVSQPCFPTMVIDLRLGPSPIRLCLSGELSKLAGFIHVKDGLVPVWTHGFPVPDHGLVLALALGRAVFPLCLGTTV